MNARENQDSGLDVVTFLSRVRKRRHPVALVPARARRALCVLFPPACGLRAPRCTRAPERATVAGDRPIGINSAALHGTADRVSSGG